MSSVLVTGANRGIGLELIERFLRHPNPPAVVIGTARDPAAAKELAALKKLGNVVILQLDVNKPETFEQFAEEVSKVVGSKGLNVLINNAAIPARLGRVPTSEDYVNIYRTNTIGPILLTQALLPLLQTAATINKDLPLGIARAAVLNMSSLLGSLTLNNGPSFSCYRESKSALNQASRSLAASLKDDGILVTVLHPGWVRTDLGGPEAPLGVKECGEGLINVIYSLDDSKHGLFVAYDGQLAPW